MHLRFFPGFRRRADECKRPIAIPNLGRQLEVRIPIPIEFNRLEVSDYGVATRVFRLGNLAWVPLLRNFSFESFSVGSLAKEL